MITLWGRSDSSNVRKILWCLNELSLEYKHIPAGGKFEIVNTPEYLQLNPNSLVPCLQDGDLILWESHTILRYLAEKYGQNFLFISDIQQRYTAEKWLDWCLSTISPILRNIMLHTIKLPLPQRNSKILSQAVQELEAKFGILNEHLKKNTFIADEQFSIVDIALGSFVYTLKNIQILQSMQFQNIDVWMDNLLKRAALQVVLNK